MDSWDLGHPHAPPLTQTNMHEAAYRTPGGLMSGLQAGHLEEPALRNQTSTAAGRISATTFRPTQTPD